MATVHDVAAYILQQHGAMSALKLHMLVYYAQALSLAQRAVALFPETIEAWPEGPMVVDLCHAHQGFRHSCMLEAGDPGVLTLVEQASINSSSDFYATFSAEELSGLSRAEKPWLDGRGALPPTPAALVRSPTRRCVVTTAPRTSGSRPPWPATRTRTREVASVPTSTSPGSASEPTVHDVAAYVLRRRGPMAAMKLQKLVYYCQAWSLVWDERSMFPEAMEAWAMGPVSPDRYERHSGVFLVEAWDGDASALDAAAVETTERVLAFYADKAPQWLSDLAHAEDPWKHARGNLGPGELSHVVITQAAMAEYYEAISG